MHGDEGDEREGSQEMQRAGRLSAAEQIEQPGATALKPGDMVSPVPIISGSSTKITAT